MSNHRYSKWWWQDWRGDACLQRCSFAAKGLWMDVLCLLSEGNPYGHLRTSDRDLTEKDLVDLLPRSTKRQITKLLDELESKRVFSRTSDGTIYSRRMVRDGNLSEKGTKAAQERWGKPNGSPNGGGNGTAKARPYGPPTSTPNGKPSAIDHRSESEADAEALACAPRKGVFYLNEKKEEPEPTTAEILANRKRQLAALAESPAAEVVKEMAGELRHFALAPGKKAKLDIHDQIDEIGSRRQIKAFYLSDEQLGRKKAMQ